MSQIASLLSRIPDRVPDRRLTEAEFGRYQAAEDRGDPSPLDLPGDKLMPRSYLLWLLSVLARDGVFVILEKSDKTGDFEEIRKFIGGRAYAARPAGGVDWAGLDPASRNFQDPYALLVEHIFSTTRYFGRWNCVLGDSGSGHPHAFVRLPAWMEAMLMRDLELFDADAES